jgi:hypothetical protein
MKHLFQTAVFLSIAVFWLPAMAADAVTGDENGLNNSPV